MKLPIKKKYFDLIKQGKKQVEFRAAHITFVCEETGEELRKEVTGCDVSNRIDFLHFGFSHQEAQEMFGGEKIIIFGLR